MKHKEFRPCTDVFGNVLESGKWENVVSQGPGNLSWSAVAGPGESPAAMSFEHLGEPRPRKEVPGPRRKNSGSSRDTALPSLGRANLAGDSHKHRVHLGG